ncbi:hypothetical protein [Pseudomonas sp. CGJS7]|uniref:hypothetical protein n=1 Tax=Pseudomonas sp. CGJS7 TaxID=3109348 RepID=UPI003008BAB1
MNDYDHNVRADLLSLRDCIERILLANGPIFDSGHQLTLRTCQGLFHALSANIIAARAAPIYPANVIRWVELCRLELISLERTIDQVDGWNKPRALPIEFSEDEWVLRALYDHIDRFLDGMEPEYALLPTHVLDRVLRQLKLLTAWDVGDEHYALGLRFGIRGAKRAYDAAESAPHN